MPVALDLCELESRNCAYWREHLVHTLDALFRMCDEGCCRKYKDVMAEASERGALVRILDYQMIAAFAELAVATARQLHEQLTSAAARSSPAKVAWWSRLCTGDTADCHIGAFQLTLFTSDDCHCRRKCDHKILI